MPEVLNYQMICTPLKCQRDSPLNTNPHDNAHTGPIAGTDSRPAPGEWGCL
jgi:hypothetical protein